MPGITHQSYEADAHARRKVMDGTDERRARDAPRVSAGGSPRPPRPASRRRFVLRLTPDQAEQVSPDQTAERPDQSPVHPEAPQRRGVDAVDPGLGAQAAAAAAGIDAEVPHGARVTRLGEAAERFRLNVQGPARRAPETAHQSEDDLLARSIGQDHEAARDEILERGPPRWSQTPV